MTYWLTYFLGLEFLYTDKGILMHQRKYTIDMVKWFKMMDCNHIITHSELNSRKEETKDEEKMASTSIRCKWRKLTKHNIKNKKKWTVLIIKVVGGENINLKFYQLMFFNGCLLTLNIYILGTKRVIFYVEPWKRTQPK